MSKKQQKHTVKVASQTSTGVPLSPAAGANYLLEQISAGDMAKLWEQLTGCVKAAKRPITLGPLGSGTIEKGDFQADAIVYTTEDGFVFHFIATGMCK